ncbi:hypothetical protein RDWZM_006414 [Blomia tropicalis]|uniref:diacylglycerol O-acyltransferase n=1 Tax=Blomia tropicalis TaxID=40697 RepID=A0A9Q0M9L7_BLOTA|nr:hypothetical protein RDWZM_006414 [Blomia tropicalis]
MNSETSTKNETSGSLDQNGNEKRARTRTKSSSLQSASEIEAMIFDNICHYPKESNFTKLSEELQLDGFKNFIYLALIVSCGRTIFENLSTYGFASSPIRLFTFILEYGLNEITLYYLIERNWWFIARCVIETILLMELQIVLIEQWIYVPLEAQKFMLRQLTLSEFILKWTKMSLGTITIWLIGFYSLFQSISNLIAELILFADREFYRDWWNAKTISEFWRSWNIPIHRWCVRHLLKPLLIEGGVSSTFATFAIFLVSGIFHEYVISVPVMVYASESLPSNDSTESAIEELNNRLASPEGRIVNGERVTNGSRSFQIGLFRRGRFICGGSLFASRWVITAAHCVYSTEPDQITIVYGTLQYRNGPKVGVEKIWVHPNYDQSNVHDDLAIIKLAKEVNEKTDSISYVKLNQIHSMVNINSIVTVSGWGRTAKNQTVSDYLMKADMKAVSFARCRWLWAGIFRVSRGMLCAQDTDSGACNGCNGDSGGPLQYEIDGQWFLLGAASWVVRCGSTTYPTVWTRVPYFLNFITEISGITPP